MEELAEEDAECAPSHAFCRAVVRRRPWRCLKDVPRAGRERVGRNPVLLLLGFIPPCGTFPREGSGAWFDECGSASTPRCTRIPPSVLQDAEDEYGFADELADPVGRGEAKPSMSTVVVDEEEADSTPAVTQARAARPPRPGTGNLEHQHRPGPAAKVRRRAPLPSQVPDYVLHPERYTRYSFEEPIVVGGGIGQLQEAMPAQVGSQKLVCVCLGGGRGGGAPPCASRIACARGGRGG